MYKPDRSILERVQSYDKDLYLKWNDRKCWWELWRKADFKPHQLITPITKSIYEQGHPRSFCQLDERVLWWIYASDSWRHGKDMGIESDRRWHEFNKKLDKVRYDNFYNAGKDMYSDWTRFTMTRYQKKNGPPRFSNHKREQKWVKPDSQALTSPRLFARTKKNALQYDFKPQR